MAPASSVLSHSEETSPLRTLKFINGQWFDGQGFHRRTFYAVAGKLDTKAPARVDEVIDLQNGYVLPPFGDAHTHHFDSPRAVAQQVEMYLRDGVFYAKVQTNLRTGAEKIAGQLNIPASIDVAYAHGGVTGNYSHPMGIYEALGLGFYMPNQQKENEAQIRESRKRENDAYYIIDTEADLDKKWPLILAGKPDFLKVFLLTSEEYEARKKRIGQGEGIDPTVLPKIVAKAHASGLRVSAHIETAFDFHTALVSGVDEMAHLPGMFLNNETDSDQMYEVSLGDAKLAARHKVFIIPTANRIVLSPPEQQARLKRIMAKNIALLKKYGLKFGVGTDWVGKTSLVEAMYLKELGVFSNLELLKSLCEETPHDIFPQRKIGQLRPGFEASFIVLIGNPIESFDQVKSVRLRFKQGQLITLGEKKS